MKNVLITGVSGYLGHRLAAELLNRKDVSLVCGIDIREPDIPAEGLHFTRMDIRSTDIKKLIIEQNIDTIFHLAFIVQPIHDTKLMHDIDYNGSLNILTNAKDNGVRQVIITSSTLAYGAHKDNPPLLSEEMTLRGNKTYPYGYNKRIADEMIQAFAKKNCGLIITILRPCTVFGPKIKNYVSRMLFRRLTIGIMGSDPKVQFVHEDDMVEAALLAMEKEKPGIFNIAGDGTITTREIAKILGTVVVPLPAFLVYPLLELLWRLHFPGIEVNRGYLNYIRFPFIADNSRAKDELNFYPRYDALTTLKETINKAQ